MTPSRLIRQQRHAIPIPPEAEDYFADRESPHARLKSAANRRRSWEEPTPPTLAEILASLD